MNQSAAVVEIDSSFVSTLLEWADTQHRDLPWRQTRDPWAILVSEVMSQQTQIERVVPKWKEFLARFPTPDALASVPLGEVIALWVGLGYNRRARLLHACAVQLVDHHDGALPDQLDGLLALPGIGPYTARAVLAFAFEHDVGVVDTNVGRVLARLGGSSLSDAQAQALADDLVPEGQGWQWNQTILDFGASVCTKRNPTCSGCPLRSNCRWQASGGPDPATGSAGVSVPQSSFEGSDRQGRGRLIRALAHGPVSRDDVAETLGWIDDPDRVERVLTGLINDGMVKFTGAEVRLP